MKRDASVYLYNEAVCRCVRAGGCEKERARGRGRERANEKARERMRKRESERNDEEERSTGGCRKRNRSMVERKRERKEKNERAKRMRDRRLHLESIHGGGYTIFPINYGRFCRIIRREGTCGFVQCCLKIVRHSACKLSCFSLFPLSLFFFLLLERDNFIRTIALSSLSF